MKRQKKKALKKPVLFTFLFLCLLALIKIGQIPLLLIQYLAFSVNRLKRIELPDIKIPFAKSLTWVLIDRFLDFWMFIVVVAVSLPFVSSNIADNLVKLIIALLIVLTVLLIISIKSAVYLNKIIAIFLPLLIFPKLKSIFLNLTGTIIEGFKILDRSSKEWGIFIFLSTLAAISDGFAWYLSFNALNINISMLQSIIGNALAAFTFLVPAAPGYVGSAEAAGLAVFTGILGISTDLSSAATVLFHVTTLVSLLILGVGGLFFLKFDLSFVWKKLKGN